MLFLIKELFCTLLIDNSYQYRKLIEGKKDMTALSIQIAKTVQQCKTIKIIKPILESEDLIHEFLTITTYTIHLVQSIRFLANLCTANMDRYMQCGYNGGK